MKMVVDIIVLILVLFIFLMNLKMFAIFVKNIDKKDISTQLTEVIIDVDNGTDNDQDNRNKKILKLLRDRIEYENGSEYKEYTFINDKINAIDWRFICITSTNRNMIELLKENKDKIHWNELSENEYAIDLLRDRIECEKSLSKEEYKKISKINWKKMSKNINAIELLRDRIEYEKKLTQKEYEGLEDTDKIDWFLLSQNNNAIELLRENTNKIDWRFLSNLLE
jgi:hypothetical protein